MLDRVRPSPAVKAALNYAANAEDGGVFSNFMPSLTDQARRQAIVDIADARRLADPPSLQREGFEVHRLAMAGSDWTDAAWVEAAYTPKVLELVKRLTGAPHVATSQTTVLLRDTGDPNAPPAADFVHLDFTRGSARPFADQLLDAEARARFGRVQVYNVWRPITPPPQDVPLALCDQRTVDEARLVEGRAVEPNHPEGVPYLIALPSPAHRWHYLPDLALDEVIVFKGYDSAPDAPMGCLHTAFTPPSPPEGAVPRASVELRVFVFFEA
jgi:hypothetical protein